MGCCQSCYPKLSYVTQPVCFQCGKPLSSEEIELCMDCCKFPKSFEENRAVFVYSGDMQSSLTRFKFQNRREYATFYGRQIVEAFGQNILEWNVQAILPVPVHSKKKKNRGYNQAELIAKYVGSVLQLPVMNQVLVRSVNTVAQKELNNVQRLKNLEHAFIVKNKTVLLKKVLIIDDIYTTGSTLEACTRVLHQAGIEDVYCVTVAIGKGY